MMAIIRKCRNLNSPRSGWYLMPSPEAFCQV